jgi:predicted nucleic acid-binding protein
MQFLDTNILLYRISSDPREKDKARRAEEILERQDLGLSVQVLQEFYVQATRPSCGGALSHREAMELVRAWRRYPVQEITVPLMERAMEARDQWGISYWDAAVIEAARELGCGEILSEDLSAGQNYRGIRIKNPFAE